MRDDLPEPEDRAGAEDAPAPGAHPSADELRRFLDEGLPATRAEGVEQHLERCDRCAATLEELAPPVEGLTSEPAAWDERATRRAVRRTLLRTAVDVVAIIGVLVLTATLLSWLVWHPLVIDRGDRLERNLQATLDLPVLTVPGAEVTQWRSNPGPLRRHTEVDVVRPVGAVRQDLGTQESWIGPFRATQRPLPPVGLPGTSGEQVAFEPDRLGAGTAVTVEVVLDGVPVTDAAQLLPDDDEVALTWVGFAVVEADTPSGAPVGNPLGYSACADLTDWEPVTSMGGFGRGWGGPGTPTGDGVDHALRETRRALDNLAVSGLAGGLRRDLDQARAALADDPLVDRLVVTGPTGAVAEVVDASGARSAWLLGVDHDLGEPTPCG